MLRPLVVLGAASVAILLPSGMAFASPESAARKLARQHFAVLRTAARPADRVPGLADTHALTRRAGRVDGRTLWLGVTGTRLCLWLRTDAGGHGQACSSVARAVRPASSLALVYGGLDGLTAAVALPDGASHARAVARGGATTRLRIRRGAIVYRTKARGTRLVWDAADGSEIQMVVAKP
jgi:hypothetical protein